MKTYSAEFEAAEAQVKTRPAYLYFISIGSTMTHLARFDSDIIVTGLPAAKGGDPQTFTSCACSHSTIKQDSEPSTQNPVFTIGLNESDLTNTLKAFILNNPPDEIQVIIVRVNSAALPGPIVWGTDTFVQFKGVVTGVTFNRSTIQLALLSLLLQNEGKVPRYYWQKTCQHALYGSSCGVDRTNSNFHLATTISAVNSRFRYVDLSETMLGGAAIETKTFQGGTIHLMDGTTIVARLVVDRCEILGGGNPRLWLRWWHTGLVAAASVKVYRGCNRTIEDCAMIFANQASFGGMPFVPDINPTVHGFRV